MGADIHCYVEYKYPHSHESWTSFGKGINPGRHYLLFERMAGVRGSPDHAIVQPRGIPDDLGYYAHEDWKIASDPRHACHTPSWLTLKEFARVLTKYEVKCDAVAPVEYRALCAAMQCLATAPAEVRLVFWFDS